MDYQFVFKLLLIYNRNVIGHVLGLVGDLFVAIKIELRAKMLTRMISPTRMYIQASR